MNEVPKETLSRKHRLGVVDPLQCCALGLLPAASLPGEASSCPLLGSGLVTFSARATSCCRIPWAEFEQEETCQHQALMQLSRQTISTETWRQSLSLRHPPSSASCGIRHNRGPTHVPVDPYGSVSHPQVPVVLLLKVHACAGLQRTAFELVELPGSYSPHVPHFWGLLR